MRVYFYNLTHISINNLIEIMETDDNQVRFTIELVITKYHKYNGYEEEEKYDLRNFLSLIHEKNINEKVKEIQRQIYEELKASY